MGQDAELGEETAPADHRSRGRRRPSEPEQPVRSRRSKPRTPKAAARLDGPVVAVTGAAGPVGRALVQRLAERARLEDGVGSVVAIDAARDAVRDGVRDGGSRTGRASARGRAPAEVSWRHVDVRDPSVVTALTGRSVVVHAVVPDVPEVHDDPGGRGRTDGDARHVDGWSGLVDSARAVLTAAAAGVGRAVVVTSAMVYGAAADNAVPLDEDAALRAVADGPATSALLEVEDIAAAARAVHPGLQVTVVRPAILVGPGVDSVFTRHFEAPRLLVVKGCVPHWQFCHVDDLVSALEAAALGPLDGVVTVACDGFLTQAAVEDVTGMRSIELPARLAYGTAERLHRIGITPAPASELAYTAEPWVVPSTRLRAAGWEPAHDNASALAALVEEKANRAAARAAAGGRHLGRDATLGAAGATVAVLGTAAVVRQIRRQRRGG